VEGVFVIAEPVDCASDLKPKRFLLMTTAYGPGQTHAPLIESLGEYLTSQGHHVRVVGIDWSAKLNGPVQHWREPWGVDVTLFAPRVVPGLGRFGTLLAKWLWSSVAAARAMRRELRDGRYDVLFVMTPAVALAAMIRWAQARATHSYAYITDFFPFHHVDLGLLPGGMFEWGALRLENGLLDRFDTIGCMTKGGVRFLRSHYRIHADQPAEVLPPWGDTTARAVSDRAETRRRYGVPHDRPVVVFGGQITHGRGIEDILQAASLAARKTVNLQFVLVGNGPLVSRVAEHIALGDGNLTLLPPVAREEYLLLIAACDVALVATTDGVRVPAFPSKTIDYLRAGLPVVASVDEATDYGEFVEEHGFGFAVRAGDSAGMVEAICRIVSAPALAHDMRAAGRATLSNVYDVKNAARHLLADFETRHEKLGVDDDR
jgi:glycosyltransferase involved in cell wall biosynthesis